MADLKTTYKDDVLDTTKNTKRRFNMITNSDGTVSFEDVTEYSQVGDSFGAADINATNEAVSALNTKTSSLYSDFKDFENLTFNINGEVINTGYNYCATAYKLGAFVVLNIEFGAAFFDTTKGFGKMANYRPKEKTYGRIRCRRTTNTDAGENDTIFNNVWIDTEGVVYQGFNSDKYDSHWTGSIFICYPIVDE